MNKPSWLVLALVLVGQTALLLWRWQANATLREDIAALNRQESGLSGSVAAARVALQAVRVREPEPTPETDLPETPELKRFLVGWSGNAGLKSYPFLNVRSSLASVFAPQLRELRLSPEKQAVLLDWMAEQQIDKFFVGSLARVEGLEPRADSGYTTVAADFLAESNARIKALLGDVDFERLERFRRSNDLREGQLSEFAHHVELQGMRLSDEQIQQLSDTVLSSAPADGTGIPRITDQAVQKAIAILTPAQVDAFRQYREVWEAKRIIAQMNIELSEKKRAK